MGIWVENFVRQRRQPSRVHFGRACFFHYGLAHRPARNTEISEALKGMIVASSRSLGVIFARNPNN